MHKTVRKVLRAVADVDPDYYDMYRDANERSFGQLYVERITAHAADVGIHPPATLLEAGCQAGRLLVPFARAGFAVTGIDTSGFALRRAREHARAAGVSARLVRGDLIKVLEGARGTQYDIVVCAEVIYLSRQHTAMLKALARAVRPGGLLCISHRPLGYYLLQALRQQDVAMASEILARREGPTRDGDYDNWQDEEQLRAMYAELGFEWREAAAIDCLAWLSGVQPAELSDTAREAWRRMERELAPAMAMCGRYVLIVARKPEGASLT